MNVPIRMLGLATTFFWIFLAIFLVSAMYSIRYVDFHFGDLQFGLDSENKLLFSQPITIVNRGYYNIGFFNVTTTVLDVGGYIVASGSDSIPNIRKSGEVTLLHNLTVDVNDLIQANLDFLFNDTSLSVNETVSMNVAEMIPVQASSNFTIPWGAPMYDFRLGEPTYAFHNSTHLRVSVPMNFENHAIFDLVGTAQVRMINSANTVMGEGQTTFNVAQQSPYNRNMELYVLISGITETGRFEVSFQTAFFSCGPQVIPYG